MFLEIITPEKKAFEGEVTSVKFPGISGEFFFENSKESLGQFLGFYQKSFSGNS